MAGSVYDSPLFAGLFPPGAAGRLFTDSAEVRAMLLVEGTLAKVQGDLGVIPTESAAYIHRAAMEVQVDPAGLADKTAQNGVCVPALVAAFRDEMKAPEHAQYAHWGATSQDIIDTGLMLRLRQLLSHCETALTALLTELGAMAQSHAATPMAARTWGQHATVTTFGAQVAEWGQPLADLLDRLDMVRRETLFVSLSGAAGTGNALEPKARETRAALATTLGLNDPGRSWHVDRTPIRTISHWLTGLCLNLGKMGEDITLMLQSGIGEVLLGAAGASSTMPQKQNPVLPSVLVAIARQTTALNSALDSAAMPRNQRDGAAMLTEWMSLPQICLGAAAALQSAGKLVDGLDADQDAMLGALDGQLGLIHAEALSFALTAHLPRPEAQTVSKALCREALDSGAELSSLVARDWPDLDRATLFSHKDQTGTAAVDAIAFAARVTTPKPA